MTRHFVTLLNLSIIMFSIFKSRWTMLFRCKYSTAERIYLIDWEKNKDKICMVRVKKTGGGGRCGQVVTMLESSLRNMLEVFGCMIHRGESVCVSGSRARPLLQSCLYNTVYFATPSDWQCLNKTQTQTQVGCTMYIPVAGLLACLCRKEPPFLFGKSGVRLLSQIPHEITSIW